MKSAGVRQLRQNLSVFLEEVKRGAEILVRERGKPVAKIVPYTPAHASPFPDLTAFRASVKYRGPPPSAVVLEDREDRL